MKEYVLTFYTEKEGHRVIGKCKEFPDIRTTGGYRDTAIFRAVKAAAEKLAEQVYQETNESRS